MMKDVTVGIIGGRGRMGRIFQKFFAENGCRVLISGRKTKLTPAEMVHKSDVVIISVPMEETVRNIQGILPYTRKEQLLIDLTSLKKDSVPALLKSKASVISLHPMFVSVSSLEGQTILVMPARAGRWKAWILGLLKKNKVKTLELKPQEHDTIMALLQGMIHFSLATTAYSLAQLAKKNRISMKKLLAAGGAVYRIRLGMMARILSQPEIYADIAMMNPKNNEIFDEYIKNAQKFSDAAAHKDKKRYIQYFNEAHDFFGDFNAEAVQETSFLIEQLGKMKRKKK